MFLFYVRVCISQVQETAATSFGLATKYCHTSIRSLRYLCASATQESLESFGFPTRVGGNGRHRSGCGGRPGISAGVPAAIAGARPRHGARVRQGTTVTSIHRAEGISAPFDVVSDNFGAEHGHRFRFVLQNSTSVQVIRMLFQQSGYTR